jgi:hypothetical protein
MVERLRRIEAPSSVPGSLPVLHFGELERARVATIGLNPSWQEYLTPGGSELDGAQRRLETLRSIGAADRPSLTDEHCARAIEAMHTYFEPGKPVYAWFRPLARVAQGLGVSFTDGSAVHLNLVQEATNPAWSKLPPRDVEQLLDQDLDFLRWQIETFDLALLVCTSATVLTQVLPMVHAEITAQGPLARLRWTAALGRVNTRPITIVGWNIPLLRPTGLDAAGQHHLGELLRDQVNQPAPNVLAERPTRPGRSAQSLTR